MEARSIIKQIMKSKKITNAELAKILGVSQATIWDRLNNKKGRKDIPVSLLNEMLSALGYTVAIVPDTYTFANGDGYIVNSSKEIREIKS